MKFASFESRAKGLKARRTISLPMLDGGDPVKLDISVLSFDDDTAIQEKARAFAFAHGSTNPVDGDPIYERGKHLHTVLATCLDTDVKNKAEPFFASEKEIGSLLDPDRVAFLYHHQRAWQDEVNPSPRDIPPLQFVEMCMQYSRPGEADEIPFASLPLRTQRSFVRQLASGYFGLLRLKSDSGSAIAAAGASSASSSSQGTPPSTDPPKPPTAGSA
jgi:hypothetical protein